MKITREQARHFLLAHQKLWPPRELAGKVGAQEYIRHVGSIQFDPLNMVGMNPDLVLQSRVKDYQPEYLQELLYTDRKLVDGLDKNMCIYAVEDWPYCSRQRERAFQQYGNENRPAHAIFPAVREELKKRGPLSSIDLDFDTKVNWAWGPTRAARAALESMYLWGELIIHHKAGTRKVYDFAEKYLAPELLATPDPNVTEEQFHAWAVKRRVGAIGLLWNRPSDAWLGIHGLKSQERTTAFASLLERGEVQKVEVEDIKQPVYIRQEDELLLQEVLKPVYIPQKDQLLSPEVQKSPTCEMNGPGPAKVCEATFIAPLDNMLWDRKLIQALFDFEYTWEVYKPISERRYGYYVLPVLYGDRFIARIEPRLNKNRQLEVLNWWWESGVTVTDEIAEALRRCFAQFVNYLGADGVQVSCVDEVVRSLVQCI